MTTETTWIWAQIAMETVHCWVCGLHFAVDHKFINEHRKNGGSFKCPAGCSLTYGEGSHARELRISYDKRMREQRWRESAERDLKEVRKSLTATKGVVTRIKNRVAKGVCPCCKRCFPNLARHMETCHPTYIAESHDDG